MRIVSKLCMIVAILLWAVALFALSIVLLSNVIIPEGYQYVSIFDVAGNEWLMPCWISSVVGLAVAIILCITLKKKEGWSLLPMILAAAAAAVGLAAALAMRNTLPEQVGVQYINQGITVWKLIWRHLTPTISGILVIIAAALNRLASRNDRIRAENAGYTSRYDLSGEPLFADAEKSTIGLDAYGEDFGIKKPARKLKRSLRRKQK